MRKKRRTTMVDEARSDAAKSMRKDAAKIPVDKAKSAYRKKMAGALGKRALKAAAKRVGPTGLAYSAYEVSQGRVPMVDDYKDIKSIVTDPDVQEAFKNDPVGFSKDVAVESGKAIGRSIRDFSKEKQRMAKENPEADVSNFAKGGEVRKRNKAGHCRGYGCAVQGTKFKGVK